MGAYVPLPNLNGTARVGSDAEASYAIIDIPEVTGGAIHDGAVAYLAVYEPSTMRTVYDRLMDVPAARTGCCVCGFTRRIL